uniref:Peptidase A1 domain-containing protein n=1 Tax=Panagrellus redivivus TaxID=6233 RepID=A0A7E4VT56_PANRE
MLLFVILVFPLLVNANKVHVRKNKSAKGYVSPSLTNVVSNSEILDPASNGMLYRGNVTIGTPPQVLETDFDTGSFVFWAMDSTCRGRDCADVPSFYRSASSTYRPLGLMTILSYGSGAAEVEIGRDTLSFANVTIPSMDIGLAIRTQDMRDVQSLFGLGPEQGVTEYGKTPLYTAYTAGAMSDPRFSILLYDAEDGSPGGDIYFGGVDSENCEATGPAISIGTSTYWTVDVTGVNFGSTALTAPSFNAIVDSGTSALYFPRVVVREISNSLGVFNGILPCSTTIPDLTLTIAGIQHTIAGKELLLETGTSYCYLNVFSSSDFYILGDPFMKNRCTIHNVVDKTIAFAQRKNKTSS